MDYTHRVEEAVRRAIAKQELAKQASTGALAAASAGVGLGRMSGGAIMNVLDALKTALLATMAISPIVGYGAGRVLANTSEPNEQDWEVLRKRQLLNYFKVYQDRAEQQARQMLGKAE